MTDSPRIRLVGKPRARPQDRLLAPMRYRQPGDVIRLIAGLTGAGMQPGPAVSAVLLYRLATYWLPVLPGWLCWRSLQHHGYV
jgi:hypothetical protein